MNVIVQIIFKDVLSILRVVADLRIMGGGEGESWAWGEGVEPPHEVSSVLRLLENL